MVLPPANTGVSVYTRSPNGKSRIHKGLQINANRTLTISFLGHDQPLQKISCKSILCHTLAEVVTMYLPNVIQIDDDLIPSSILWSRTEWNHLHVCFLVRTVECGIQTCCCLVAPSWMYPYKHITTHAPTWVLTDTHLYEMKSFVTVTDVLKIFFPF